MPIRDASFLTKVTLPHRRRRPRARCAPADTTLLAATANLVVSEHTHPALISLLLQATSEVHGKSGFFQRTGEFPAYLDTSFELNDDARRFMKSGPPFLQRYLPFWAAVFVDRMVVLLLPLIALLVPLMRIAPAIYTWRIRSKIFRVYGELKFLESEVRRTTRRRVTPSSSAASTASRRRRTTATYAAGVYRSRSHLREHINLVRKQLLRREQELISGERTE